MTELKLDPQIEKEMEKLSYPEAPKIMTEMPGPKSKALWDKEMANETVTRMCPNIFGGSWAEAFGATIKDSDGNITIDLVSGVGVNTLGHCHPKVVETIRRECAILGHTSDMVNPNRQKLGEKISQIAPGNLKGNVRMQYGLSGTSAIETAVKFARKATGRQFTATFDGCFHGCIGEAGVLSSFIDARAEGLALNAFHYPLHPYAYCYRCPFRMKYPECDLECAKYVEWQLTNPRSAINAENIASFLIEPFQAEGGCVFPPDGYLNRIKEMCEKFGILYLDDEVQAGMGRTAKFFAIEHYGVEPDIIILGKAFGGDVPFSGMVINNKTAEKLLPCSHVITAVGNATSCAVAHTNIELLQNGLLERGAILGEYLIDRMKDLSKEREIIGDVRGKGMAVGLELVKNRETKEPLLGEETNRILLRLRDKGVYDMPCGRYDNVLRLLPPLVITKAHLDKAIEIVSEVLKEAEDKGVLK
jgi:4-aminobutyrate aminotransferase